MFQLAWVGGAFIPALLPIDFRTGILMLAAFYVAIAAAYVVHAKRGSRPSGDAEDRTRGDT